MLYLLEGPFEPDPAGYGRIRWGAGIVRWESALASAIEVAIAISGFSGIVAAVGHRSTGNWSPDDQLRLRVLLTASGIAGAFAFAPFILLDTQSEAGLIWRVGSGVMAAWLIAIPFYRRRQAAQRGATVVITLIYLAFQIRQNTEQIRHNTSTARSSAAAAINQVSNSFSTLIVQEAEVSRIWWTGLKDPESLSEADYFRFSPLVNMIVSNAQQAHAQFVEGVISQVTWASFRETLAWLSTQPGFLTYWQQWKRTHDAEFAQLVSEIIEQTPLAARQSAAADSAQA